MLSVEDWAEIRRLHRSERLPIKAIARVMGISRNTVRSALAADGPPKYQRAKAGSIVDPFEPRIRELLAQFPTMPATVIAERIGWEHSIRVLSGRVAELRPVYLPPDPASRTTYRARGDRPVRFLVPPDHPAGRPRAIPDLDETAGVDDDLRLFPLVVGGAGAHPRRRGPVRGLVAAARPPRRGAPGAGVGRRGRGRAATPPPDGTDPGLSGFPRHPRGEGADLQSRRPGGQGRRRTQPRLSGNLVPAGPLVHRPGRLQPAVVGVGAGANTRRKRVLGCAPADRIDADRQAMLTLPPVPPPPGGAFRPGWPAIITSGSTPTTIRCIRR